eukprot:CAMPEP_0183440720 /NCGR_PEP_ID=MMETSP0370-20130417/82552_1 /TAXON_ID=268820 /ORGANISM="Peridinium aciculiferum, Strain PAER-2" /LENGTH=255 /DNA_ID=CAMNT_0025629683 /DNA_START=42 /DNA_END=809 /DNA_ORIENTATION=+
MLMSERPMIGCWAPCSGGRCGGEVVTFPSASEVVDSTGYEVGPTDMLPTCAEQASRADEREVGESLHDGLPFAPAAEPTRADEPEVGDEDSFHVGIRGSSRGSGLRKRNVLGCVEEVEGSDLRLSGPSRSKPSGTSGMYARKQGSDLRLSGPSHSKPSGGMYARKQGEPQDQRRSLHSLPVAEAAWNSCRMLSEVQVGGPSEVGFDPREIMWKANSFFRQPEGKQRPLSLRVDEAKQDREQAARVWMQLGLAYAI